MKQVSPLILLFLCFLFVCSTFCTSQVQERSQSITISPVLDIAGGTANISLQKAWVLWYSGLYSAFVGSVQIGNPPQTVNNVIFDTTTSDTWFHGGVWSPEKSTTFVNTSIHANHSILLSGVYCNISGVLVEDTITLGGIPITNQTFFYPTQSTGATFQYINGVVGLGFQNLAKNGTKAFLTNLLEQNVLAEQVFSLNLPIQTNGYLYFGGTEPDKYKEPVLWMPLNLHNDTYWQVAVNDLLFGSSSLGLCPNGCNAILDTGAPWWYASPPERSKMTAGVQCFNWGSNFTLSLENGQEHQDFNITYNYYVWYVYNDNASFCQTVFQSSPILPPSTWTIGTLFAWGRYLIFDFKSKQVGFAELK